MPVFCFKIKKIPGVFFQYVIRTISVYAMPKWFLF